VNDELNEDAEPGNEGSDHGNNHHPDDEDGYEATEDGHKAADDEDGYEAADDEVPSNEGSNNDNTDGQPNSKGSDNNNVHSEHEAKDNGEKHNNGYEAGYEAAGLSMFIRFGYETAGIAHGEDDAPNSAANGLTIACCDGTPIKAENAGVLENTPPESAGVGDNEPLEGAGMNHNKATGMVMARDVHDPPESTGVDGTGVSEHANDECETDDNSLGERNTTTKLSFLWKRARPDIQTKITGVMEEVNDGGSVSTVGKKLMDECVGDLFGEALDDMDKVATTPASDDHGVPGEMLVQMDDYVRDLLKKAPENMGATAVTPVVDHDDNDKLGQTIKCPQGAPELELMLDADNGHISEWWVDVPFAMYNNVKSRTERTQSLGKRSARDAIIRQELNTRSWTETKLVDVEDVMTLINWKSFVDVRRCDIKVWKAFKGSENTNGILLKENEWGPSGHETRHINIHYFIVTDQVQSKELMMEYCPTGDMLANTFRKPLQESLFPCPEVLVCPATLCVPGHRSVLRNRARATGRHTCLQPWKDRRGANYSVD
jgi:hypothetical protein